MGPPYGKRDPYELPIILKDMGVVWVPLTIRGQTCPWESRVKHPLTMGNLHSLRASDISWPVNLPYPNVGPLQK